MAEHPSFIRAKTFPEPWRSHFPKTTAEAQAFEAYVQYEALAPQVLAAMQTRVEGAWCAYIDAVPGRDHSLEATKVLRHGTKLWEEFARVLFPYMKEVPYAP